MAKEIDYVISAEITDIAEKMIEKFEVLFSHVDLDKIIGIHVNGKKNGKEPIKLVNNKFPYNVIIDNKVYFAIVDSELWKEMNEKRRNLAVFHILCSLPEGAFDVESKDYGKIKKPDYKVFREEYLMCGAADWLDNDAAKDPLNEKDVKTREKSKKVPVTTEDVENV
jgi:hypothetical protein